MGLLLTWLVLSPLGGSLQGYHSVSQLDAPRPEPLSSEAFIQRWAAARRLSAQPIGAEPPLPVLVVAASGGGIRAAYWTAAVVDCLIERTDAGNDACATPAGPEGQAQVESRRARFLLGSGVSGGSLGLASYVTAVGPGWQGAGVSLAPTWYRDRLGDDYLAPVVASLLFNDGLNSLLRPEQGVDRAGALERAWSASWDNDELSQPWLGAQASGRQPLLALNGYSVNDGCRVAVTPLVANGDRTAATCRNPEAEGETLLNSTIDVSDLVCHDLTTASAALLSARFPFISPSGRIDSCPSGGPVESAAEAIEVVDGGYRETSGASTIVEAWPTLVRQLAKTTGRCVVPVFVQIDNGYRSDEIAPTGSTGQLLAPLIGLTKSSTGYEAAARTESRRMFDHWFTITTRAHPGSQAPLGWLLSSDAKEDLEQQLNLNKDDIRAIRRLLDQPSSASTSNTDEPGCP